MANNMKGFWASILGLVEWKDSIPLLITIVYYFIYRRNNAKENYYLFAILTLMLSFALHVSGMAFLCKERDTKPIVVSPFSNKGSGFYIVGVRDYTGIYSVYHSFLHDLDGIIKHVAKNEDSRNDISYAEMDTIKANCPNIYEGESQYSNRVLIILVESLENWVINEEYTPNLYKLIKHDNVLYAPHVKSQVGSGMSADGQMIVNTGALPIFNGAACFRYPGNNYPGIAKRATGDACTLIPHDPSVWNQNIMSSQYGYSCTIPQYDEDAIVNDACKLISDGDFQVVQTLTLISHMPFVYAKNVNDILLPQSMPSMMSDYIKCIWTTDKRLSGLLDLINNPETNDITLVITGDHTVFQTDKRKQFNDYCHDSLTGYECEEYCPLIIYSPSIKQSTIISDECYQMDIYPTMLDLLNINDDASWRGFGKSLITDETRRYSVEDARIYSDIIIRGNLFSN